MKLTLTHPIFKNRSENHKQPQNRVDHDQAQRLSDIGQQLRDARMKNSFSLGMVAAYTRIRTHLLQAIEEGKIDSLPEPIYTQGLIRQYADALGLNGEELANFFLPEPGENTLVRSLKLLSMPQLRPTHLYLTYTLLIICAVNALSYLVPQSGELAVTQTESATEDVVTPQPNPATTTPPPPQGQLVSQSSAPAPAPAPVPAPAPAPAPAPQPIIQDVEVGIVVKDESWVLIEIDGKTEFQGILPGGTQKTWKAKTEVVVVAGNAGGVLVKVNNGEARRLGEPGMVQEAVFKAGNSDETADLPSS
ncbi:helix-turn-helix domain-containing protein [Arthrospira platensis]|jgi:cytoskeletal protein RodZ|uniref:Cytoskeleton protein RodZ-like C-terminal domain-containing protein n=1 Tax=Limnospira platensis NIES-46 TaxID=1236695 RepID=A0A5M3TCK1_LIMPL|nr:helix-turn-helix domain-containing protein [Arthrospira platensis]AMW26919.1 XRE family transcriptional regulator [Arthrospira platensis YZ]KDR54581.1 XRE family transcriptional regulator [Arthrospira platensis str. Paraca]MBD2710445.1 helix-turn-helix domain-containing protein [Arthrospira platensis FACHB-835]MDF2211687.1 helix-turn-helix domain-containing protein [Arthrospira platensis NCB002]MDT9294455.1 helix-turn-helix domain-containing protein [Arthrospira platensis PCC 7345]MDT93107